MPSKPCRLRLAIATVTLIAAPQLALAQQTTSTPQPYNNTAPQQRRVAAAPQQQLPAAGAPRTMQAAQQQVQQAPQGTQLVRPGTQPVRRAPAAGSQQAAQQPGRQYPVRQAAGTEPLPQQGTQRQPIQQQPVQQQGVPQQQPGAAPQGAQMAVPLAPVEPFVLTPEQQRLLDQILLKWEKESDTVTRFSCRFYRWDVNETFGPPERNYQLNEVVGDIKYSAPDHGAYVVRSLKEWDAAQKAYIPRGEDTFDHWVCNGDAIFEFNHKQKQLIERQLAPEMKGKAITEGPLPFVFGTKAEQLKQRYWMRDVTPTEAVGQQVWLEAHPKHQRDAANFHHAFIILDQKTFLPSALRIVQPDGKNKQDYRFDNISKNNPLAVIMSVFDAPRTPFGWTKVVIPAGGEAPPTELPPGQVQPAPLDPPRAQAPQPRGQAPAQAQQPRTQPVRQ